LLLANDASAKGMLLVTSTINITTKANVGFDNIEHFLCNRSEIKQLSFEQIFQTKQTGLFFEFKLSTKELNCGISKQRLDRP
jgi:hypothetical protein